MKRQPKKKQVLPEPGIEPEPRRNKFTRRASMRLLPHGLGQVGLHVLDTAPLATMNSTTALLR
jgi:hypothetical protein